MLRLLTSRLASVVPVLLLVSLLSFMLLRLAPGDPAQLQAGVEATPQMVAAIRQDLALDEPLPAQYLNWLGRLLHGDMGISYTSKQPVRELIGQRLPVTAQNGVLALFLIVAVGIPLGILSALR